MQQKPLSEREYINNLKAIKKPQKSSLNSFYKGIKTFMLLTGSFLGMLLAKTYGSYVFFGVFFTLFCLVSVDGFETKGN